MNLLLAIVLCGFCFSGGAIIALYAERLKILDLKPHKITFKNGTSVRISQWTFKQIKDMFSKNNNGLIWFSTEEEEFWLMVRLEEIISID